MKTVDCEIYQNSVSYVSRDVVNIAGILFLVAHAQEEQFSQFTKQGSAKHSRLFLKLW